MSTKRNAPGGEPGALNDQLGGGSSNMLPRRSVIAYCKPYPAKGITGRYWVLVIATCPHCHRSHRHGGGEGFRPSYGHRAAHCSGSNPGRGYWLEPVTEEAA